MPGIFDWELVVTDADTDRIGHVNNLSYLRWMMDAAVAHAAVQGWPTSRHLELGSGWVVRTHHIDYLRPAFPGDQVVVRTWVSGMKRISSQRRYKIVRRGEDSPLALAETTWAYVRFHDHSPQRIPPEVIESFELIQPDQEP